MAAFPAADDTVRRIGRSTAHLRPHPPHLRLRRLEAHRSTIGSNHVRFIGSRNVVPAVHRRLLPNQSEFLLDRPVSLVIGTDESLPESPDAVARQALTETEAYWVDWVRGLNLPFDWQDAVIRAAITLKLCCFEDTGGIVAALTTSLPEAAGSGAHLGLSLLLAARRLLHRGRAQPSDATRTMDFVRFMWTPS